MNTAVHACERAGKCGHPARIRHRRRNAGYLRHRAATCAPKAPPGRVGPPRAGRAAHARSLLDSPLNSARGMADNPDMLISLREFARRNGVSDRAISKAIKTGRLPSTDGKIDPDQAQPVWDHVKNPKRAGRKLGRELEVRTEVLGQVRSEVRTQDSGTPECELAEVRNEVRTQVRAGPIRQSPITISINGAEYIELAKRSEDEGVTMPAYIRMRCGLPAWNARGREMAGRTSAIKKNVMALDRLSVTIMVTDEERAHLDISASAVGLSFPQYIRTRCGWQVRQTSLPNTPERDSEEDDAWERLRQLGLESEKYFEE